MPVLIISYQFLHARVGDRYETAILTRVSASTTVGYLVCVTATSSGYIALFHFMGLGIFVWWCVNVVQKCVCHR